MSSDKAVCISISSFSISLVCVKFLRGCIHSFLHKFLKLSMQIKYIRYLFILVHYNNNLNNAFHYECKEYIRINNAVILPCIWFVKPILYSYNYSLLYKHTEFDLKCALRALSICRNAFSRLSDIATMLSVEYGMHYIYRSFFETHKRIRINTVSEILRAFSHMIYAFC